MRNFFRKDYSLSYTTPNPIIFIHNTIIIKSLHPCIFDTLNQNTMLTLFNLLLPKQEAPAYHIVAQLNDRIIPAYKGLLYTAPLATLLEKGQYGEVTGGGTVKEEPGEILFCDIQMKLTAKKSDAAIATIIQNLETCGAPKGSKIIMDDSREIPFGKMEGLAVYLDSEMYCDAEEKLFIQQELYRLTKVRNNIDRYWEDEDTTAFYFYGPSFLGMKSNIMPFLESYPSCHKARVMRIA